MDHLEQTAHRADLLTTAVNYMRETIPALALSAASGTMQPRGASITPQSPPRGLLYGPNNQPILPDSTYSYQRSAAKREGSMKNWIPQRLISRQQEALERERIVERSLDLSQSDPHAAGVADTFATTVIGPGLTPLPLLDPSVIVIDTKDPTRNEAEIQRIRSEQKAVYQTWYPIADAGRRMTFGGIQFLAERMIIVYGEYLILIRMIDDPLRPYSLACHVINPLRLKTPIDLMNDPRIKDGVELGADAEPVAYWIKRSPSTAGAFMLADISANFARIPARTGHRINVLHQFIPTQPEQVRALPASTPALKFFRDLNDYLDAELVSNIVTAAFALFIETSAGANPFDLGRNMSSFSGAPTPATDTEPRYQELVPGSIMYGAAGQKPYPIAASRPGATFEPFTKVIKKAIAMAHNVPYPVLFKDVEGVNFAGFRSAMLDAWRTYMFHRSLMGQCLCQPVYTMLQEEAYLRGNLNAPDFYVTMAALTRCEWRGSAKGDIEPVKQVQANVQAIQNNIKTREAVIAEQDGDTDVRAVFDQLAKEQKMMEERGLTEGPVITRQDSGAPAAGTGITDGEPDPETNDESSVDSSAIARQVRTLAEQVQATHEMITEIREYLI